MHITNPTKHHRCWWLGNNLRIVRIDITKAEPSYDWKDKIGFHWIRGDGIRLILPNGIMWEITI